MCTFDFSGTGKSEGDWVTLGHKEQHDLKSVIEYLNEHKKVSSIGLWGRSMGAVTSILYMSNEENLGTYNCAVLDSGFSSLQYLMNSLAGQMGIPPEFVGMLQPMIEMNLQQQVGMAVEDLNTEERAKLCEAPALFMHAEGDNFVVLENSQKVHAAYKGANKSLKTFAGDHNTERPDNALNDAVTFLKSNMN
jgi:dienelactone hydrolase